MTGSINDDLLDMKLGGLCDIVDSHGTDSSEARRRIRTYIGTTKFELGDLGDEFEDLALTYLQLEVMCGRQAPSTPHSPQSSVKYQQYALLLDELKELVKKHGSRAEPVREFLRKQDPEFEKDIGVTYLVLVEMAAEMKYPAGL
ncbi:MAG: hypothetical protein HY363_00535 [Candidatus Aenigmarchaeota archaeon]|nr:hypothetical protein [Candidatus Aenigmarchaeota archaeon]